MTKWICATVAALALSGCCGGGAGFQTWTPPWTPPPHVQRFHPEATWDRYGRPLARRASAKVKSTAHSRVAEPDEIALKEAELAKLKAYSPEWWSVSDAIDRARGAKLAKKLVICSTCLSVAPEERTGSIDAQ